MPNDGRGYIEKMEGREAEKDKEREKEKDIEKKEGREAEKDKDRGWEENNREAQLLYTQIKQGDSERERALFQKVGRFLKLITECCTEIVIDYGIF